MTVVMGCNDVEVSAFQKKSEAFEKTRMQKTEFGQGSAAQSFFFPALAAERCDGGGGRLTSNFDVS